MAEEDEAPSYTLHPRSKVNRIRKRAHYDYETIHTIVNTSHVVHVAFPPAHPVDDPYPALLPMIGVMGSFDDPSAPLSAAHDLYLHGYHSARLFRPSSSSSSSSSSSPSSSISVTIAATHVDGLVLALTPMHHSLNYRSAILFGHATPVVDPAEKLFALRLLTENVLPGRWAGSRVPPTPAELASTAVLRVEVESASAKVRTGGPSEDRADEADNAVRGRVWTGVLGVQTVLGPLMPAEGNRVDVPPYIRQWVEEQGGRVERDGRGKGEEEAVGKQSWTEWLGLK